MNKKNILISLLLTIPFLMFTSCLKDQEDIFEQSASKRLSGYLENVKKTLTSADNGWILNYYPDRDLSYGGYVYTLKFDEQNVEARCEMDDPSNAITTTYSLCNEDGPSLLFDTYNEYLHLFSTPTGSSGPGGYEAYDGDHMFLILNVAEDGNTITLKGSRSGNIMYMYKLEEKAESYISKVLEMEDLLSEYSRYSVTVGKEEALVLVEDFNYFYFITSKGEEIEAPGIFTPEGLVFANPVKIGGRTITGFTAIPGQGDEESTFIALNNSSTVFTPVIPPLNEQLISGEWYISYSGFSAYGQTYLDKVVAAQENIGETMIYGYIGANENGNFAFCFNSSGYTGSLVFKYELEDDDKITMQFALQGTGDGVWYHNNASYHNILRPFGYSAPNSFIITADDEKKPTVMTLTDVNNPENVITLSAEEINDPLNN